MRKGCLKTVMALLAGTGMALCQPSAWAGGPIARVSFEDGDSAAPSASRVSPKAVTSAPVMMDGGHGSMMYSDQGGGYYGGGGYADDGGKDDTRVWIAGEYLMWWLKGQGGPPLVTASPSTAARPGALGDSIIVVGSPDLNDDFLSGARVTVGFWLDCDKTLGIEAVFFGTERRTDTRAFASNGQPGSPVLARPFIDATTGQQSAEIVAFPGLLSGGVAVATKTSLEGFEVNGLLNLICDCNLRVDLLGGFRYVDLEEKLGIAEHINVLAGFPTAAPQFPFLAGNTIDVFDVFSTRNQFYGGQGGAIAEWRRGNFFVDAIGKFALGTTHESVNVGGLTRVTTPAGVTTTTLGGLYALPGNIGRFTRDEFSVLSETGLNVGYQVSSNFRVYAGYSFLWWSNVARPGDQIDFAINPSRVPTSLTFNPNATPARPTHIFSDTDFWAQGFNFGLEFRW